MAKRFVHICDACMKRVEDTEEYREPLGWFHVRVQETREQSGWKFLICDTCLSIDKPIDYKNIRSGLPTLCNLILKQLNLKGFVRE